MNFWHPAYLIATGFGTGLLPKAPGTWGSLLAVVLAWPIATFLGTGGMMIAILVLIPVGIWASDRVDQTKDEDDAGEIIVDEIVGQWITLLFLPPSITLYAIAFVVFRVFDIFKPWPVDHFDKHSSGGMGIMQDDIAAGLYGMLVLGVFFYFFPSFEGGLI